MKKLIVFLVKLIIIVVIMLGIISAPIIYSGYDMYKKALEQMPITEKVEEIRSKEYYTTIDKLPKMYINAVIAVEDHRFYQHEGIDIIAICRAIYNDIKAKELKEGGSTITQQLAKNIYFTQERTAKRKIAEIFMANKIEQQLDKDTIFELYVNTSYFGDGYYTIKEASEGYFNKLPIELNDYEATLIAGIPNAPSVYAPTKNLDLAHQRQKQVLNAMLEHGYISQEEYDEIINKQTK
ncbi:MAG: glycosyl transferase [Clostridiales bacterium]|nr:glycosyl transferase [Clostridiales bacterium]